MKTETDSQHTPGPWKYMGNNTGSIFQTETGKEICTLFLAPIINITNLQYASNEERADNARLIASAPDLLAAGQSIADAICKKLCETDGSGTVTFAECLDQCNETEFQVTLTLGEANALADAIAKAKGLPVS